MPSYYRPLGELPRRHDGAESASPPNARPTARPALLVVGLASLVVSSLSASIARADVGNALIPLVVLGDNSAQRYREALRRVSEGDVVDGVRRLQSLHEEIWGRNHMAYDPDRVGAREDWIVAVSLTEAIIASLSTLPDSAKEFYRGEFSTSAATLLERGLRDGDVRSLIRTSDLYPITDSAPRALLAAGDILFEENQVGRAAEVWRDMRRRVGSNSPYERALAIREGLISVRRGDPADRAAASTALATLGISVPSTGISEFHPAVAELPSLPFQRGQLEWRSVSFARDNQIRSQSYSIGGPVPYAPVPAFGDGWVAVLTSRKALRFDLDTGKQVGEVSLAPDPRFYEDERLIRFHAVTAADLLVSSYVADATDRDQYLGFDITVEVPKRALKGIRIGTDRAIWDTVRRQVADPFLAELSFNGEPTLVDGRIYALGWRKRGYIDVFLVCLDARTGERLWSAPIAGNQVELTMFGETAHEPILGTVCVDDSAVFCSTNLGVIARVRASDGHVLWATEYEAQGRRSYGGHRSYRMQARPVWERNPIILHSGRLAVTPLDSADLFVLDPEDGRVEQRVSGEQGFLVGVFEDHLVLARNGIRLIPVSDVESRHGPQFRVANEIRARPALVAEGIVYTTEEGLFHQPIVIGRKDNLPPVKLCALDELEYDINERDAIHDGVVDVLHDRILVTSSQRISCYLPDLPPGKVEKPK